MCSCSAQKISRSILIYQNDAEGAVCLSLQQVDTSNTLQMELNNLGGIVGKLDADREIVFLTSEW